MLTLPHYEIIDGQFGKYCRTRLNNCQKVKLFFKSARMQFPHVWKICVLKKQITDVILIGRFSNCQSIKKGTGRHFVKDLYKDVFFVPPCLPECYLQGETKIEPDIWLIILWLLWDTSTRRSHSAQITSPRVVGKSCLIHRFLSPLLHEQIQIHRRYSILEKTCSCNRIKLNYQATKKKIESTRKHRRLGSKFCDRLHYNYVTCSKTKKIH